MMLMGVMACDDACDDGAAVVDSLSDEDLLNIGGPPLADAARVEVLLGLLSPHEDLLLVPPVLKVLLRLQ